MIKNLLVLFLAAFGTALYAQEIGYGFKAGLNYNTLRADSETDGNGNDLEEFTNNSGFHVGATFTYKATDLMGARAELIYNQKGGRRKFQGPSYYDFTSTTGTEITTTGTRELNLNLTTSYIDIPITGYVKPIEWLEIYAGVNVGFLVSATVFGDLTYNGTTVNGTGFNAVNYEIDGNYLSDDVGEAIFGSSPSTISIGNNIIEIPSSTGVYYEFEKDLGNLYKVIDFGAIGGLSVFLNRGLYVSGRVNYGLSDITKKDADVSLVSKESSNFILRDDDDRNFSIQASIGFSF